LKRTFLENIFLLENSLKKNNFSKKKIGFSFFSFRRAYTFEKEKNEIYNFFFNFSKKLLENLLVSILLLPSESKHQGVQNLVLFNGPLELFHCKVNAQRSAKWCHVEKRTFFLSPGGCEKRMAYKNYDNEVFKKP
jgi:hypothetical protein